MADSNYLRSAGAHRGFGDSKLCEKAAKTAVVELEATVKKADGPGSGALTLSLCLENQNRLE